MGRKDSLPEDAPAPRLCELVKWPHFQGYGFNLHSEKGKEGQFIGKIDPSSPAEACGLQEGDQIIEVNGVNTSNENHKQVVERIKTNPDRASLLVVDAKTAEYYKKRNIVVKGSLPNVRRIKCAATGPGGPAQDQETGESETSSQTQLSIEDSLTLAAQGDGGDEPPPVPPKTELASIGAEDPSAAAATAEPENVELPPPAEPAPEPEPEVKPADQPAATSEEEKPAEEKPAEKKPAEEKPAEKKPAEEKPAEEKPAEEKPAEKKSEEEKPAEEKPVAEPVSEVAASEDVQDGKSQPAEKTPEKEANGTKHASPTIDTTLQVESGSDRTQPSPAPSASSTGTAESSKSAESGPTAADGDKFGLKLNMTAAEMREYLKSKKRHDPRNDNLTFKQRHEIVSNM